MVPNGSGRSPTSGSPGGLGAGLDTSEGRAFVSQRLALLGKTIFILAGAFFLVSFVAGRWPGLDAPLSGWRPAASHLAAVLIMGTLWFVARGHERSLRALGLLDACALLVTCFGWAGMIHHSDSVYVAMLAAMATVTARAAIVPSSGRRTLWLTAAALAPIVVGAAYFPPSGVTALTSAFGAAMWVGVAVATVTVTSRVIYGLRQQVKAATELGQYTLEEKIGGGGMGEVWRAHHRMLIRPAAVKLIRPQAIGASAPTEVLVRRFEREARATAALKSPHTVQLYDFGVSDDGTLYYVMELLQGFDLENLVTRFGPQPPERVVHILTQVCSSLSDAHRNGLVHRDIKPANIVVSRAGWPDFVKVLDFGLVKLEHPREQPAGARLTADAGIAGTPAFIAPEAVVGERPTDHRVDIYSVGCVAYWLLTGKLVFEGTNVMKMMIDHAHTPPAPPSTRVEQPIPPALEQIVLACLEKDPDRRPASADELADRLEALALPAWTKERADRWWDAHGGETGEHRPIAHVILSQEQRPRARLARPGTRR